LLGDRSFGFGVLSIGLCGVGGVFNARRNASSRRRAVSSGVRSGLSTIRGISFMEDAASKHDINVPGDALDRILRLFDSPDELVLIESEGDPAGTGEVIIHLKPSDRFSVLLAALRARDFDRFVVED
jgi:hypothetical protein